MKWYTSALLLATAAVSTTIGQLDQVPLKDSASGPAYRESLLDLHKSLISTPSISGDEGDVGNFLVDYLTARGYAAELQFVKPLKTTPEGEERYNVIAWPSSADTQTSFSDKKVPRVLITSHIDVVPPHIEYGISEGNVGGDTMIWGRGSVDAKGSVAAMIIALEQLLAKKEAKVDPEDVMLLFVVGEEIVGDGMRAFSDLMADREDFEAVIFGEPTENKLACGHKGGLFCEIVATGVGGHSGYPWLGKSANELVVRAMGRVIDADLGSSEQFGETTVNLGRIDGGVAANVIPEKSTVDLVVRVAIGPERGGQEVVREKIANILEEVDGKAFDFTCSQGYGFVESQCGIEGFEDIIVNYGTDIPNLRGDHKRYLYGPGTILVAHGSHENLTVADLETAVEDYQKLILYALDK